MGLPVMLNLEGRLCLVVGGGSVGVRKARTLQAAGAEVIILSPSLHETLPGVRWESATYHANWLDKLRPALFLVVAATNDATVNQIILSDARQHNLLVMSADNPSAGDIVGLIHTEQDGVTIAVHSGVPHFSRYMLRRLSAQLTPNLLTIGRWLRALRPHLKTALATPAERTAAWDAIFASPLLENNPDPAEFRDAVGEILGPELVRSVDFDVDVNEALP
jgi:uroporphyrin-III C-methyltransferase / precorrin-2 dehydrogenase / sirohydrochlorin ferrochelatase